MRLLTACVAALFFAQGPRAVMPWVPVAPGVEYQNLIRGWVSGTVSGEPQTRTAYAFYALRIDPRQADLQIVHALDQAVGVETVSSLAARHGAIAAVNGGFFRTSGTYRGDSMGALMIDGELVSEPDRGRSAMAIHRQRDGARVLFGHVRADLTIASGGVGREVNGINRQRGTDELVIFTPAFQRTTLTTPDGAEAIVRRGRVSRLVDPGGSQAIPPDGFVISASGEAASWLRRHLRPKAMVTLTRRLLPVDPSPANPWAGAEDVLGAGPQLLKNGQEAITAEREQMSASLSLERHPRTAVGTTADGRVVFAVIDGRQPLWSDGALLTELAALMRELGAEQAINLDGGGSSTMVVQGKVVNRPSDEAGERPVADAILILPRR